MRLLLDTNVFVRWLLDAPLPGSISRLISKPGNEKLVSIVSAWEIAIKPKLNLSAADIEAGIEAMGAVLLPVKLSHIDALYSIQAYDHRDPFDRMLIAQALAEDVAIVSSDQRFAEYKRLKLIWD